MRFQPIYNIAEVCFQLGLTQAVLCPGSRSAPLTMAFARHSGIRSWTFSDERSAAFTAMGMAIETKKPTVLVCTSGTAAYNLAPAVTEAFYQQIPLLVITADRPKEWIDQWDGQTIHQEGIFGPHVKAFIGLPEDIAKHEKEIPELIAHAAGLAQSYPPGPVHLNAPFGEPLYPEKDEEIVYDEVELKAFEAPKVTLSDPERHHLESAIAGYNRVLLLVGQQNDLNTALVETFAKEHFIPVVGDVISNIHGLDSTVRHADAFLKHARADVLKALQPDLLLTMGKSVISKHLKLFLRDYKPKEHWHIHPTDLPTPDPFRSLTHVVRCSPAHFLSQIKPATRSGFDQQKRENYRSLWEAEERRTHRVVCDHFKSSTQDEFSLVYDLMQALPQASNLHLANSLSVRYANFIGLQAGQAQVTVCSNRGTSGIDGCTSTAVGHALLSTNPTVLITGDLAFFYDRNAFWHNYPMPNLRIVLLNNHGGSIFGIIDGPGDLPEAREYFMTRQKLSAQNLCREFDIDYLRLDNLKKRQNLLKDFFDMDGRTKLLEIETEHEQVKQSMVNFMNQIKKNYEP